MRTLLTLGIAVIGMTAAALADTNAEKGRAIFEAHRDAVVKVEIVLKQQVSFGGGASQESESKTEATGTVINSEGLTVLSLSEVDPSSLMELMMDDAQKENVNFTIEVGDVKILLSDGTELPAEVVLRDKDLDMAFVRPKEKPADALSFVDFSGSPEIGILDPVVSINQLGRVARRAHTASIERIEAIVSKPRTFYVPGSAQSNTGLGAPAFTLDGEAVGVFFIRAIKSTDSSGGRGNANENIMIILLPGYEIVDAAAQAPPFE